MCVCACVCFYMCMDVCVVWYLLTKHFVSQSTTEKNLNNKVDFIKEHESVTWKHPHWLDFMVIGGNLLVYVRNLPELKDYK